MNFKEYLKRLEEITTTADIANVPTKLGVGSDPSKHKRCKRCKKYKRCKEECRQCEEECNWECNCEILHLG